LTKWGKGYIIGVVLEKIELHLKNFKNERSELE